MGLNNKKNKKIVCPVCKYESTETVIKQVSKFRIEKCANCGLEYTNPMPTKKELDAFYSNYCDFRAEDKVLILNARKNVELLSKYGLSKESKLVDFGCGKNIFIEYMNSKNWFGYDPYSKKYIQMVRKLGPIEWDFITMWGVLEHLTDPLKQMEELIATLKIGGKIALTTVTTESNIPYQYKPPEHVTYWTRIAIEKLFNSLGLQIIEYSSYLMIQNSDVYLQCVLRTVPNEFRKKIFHELPEHLEVPTNEIFVVGEK